MRRLALLLLGCAAACQPSAPPKPSPAVPPADAASLMVGLLEDIPGETADAPNRFGVRAAFVKVGGVWESLDPKCADTGCLASSPAKFPATTDWTIVSAGAVKGAVTAATPSEWKRYSDVGLQDVSANTPAPTVGERAMEFAGWTDIAVYRPLVAVTAPNTSDPDAWAKGELTPASLRALQTAFQARFAAVENCVAVDAGLTPFAYTAAQIAVSDVHVSSRGWSVASAVLLGYGCDGPAEDTAFSSHTYAIGPDGKVEPLGEGRMFVDAGDYDADGKSELVFAIGTYNQGGYDLRYNDFAGQAQFAFSYH